MGEKLSMTRKTVTAKKQRAFIDWRGRDCIDAAGRTQLNCGFDVTGRGFTRRARLDPGFDQSTDIVEMINDWFGNLIGKRLSSANDVVARLKIQSACRVSEQLSIADDHRHANLFDFLFSNRFENHFRSD